MTNTNRYIDTSVYRALVARLEILVDDPSLAGKIEETLGLIGGIWPDSCLADSMRTQRGPASGNG